MAWSMKITASEYLMGYLIILVHFDPFHIRDSLMFNKKKKGGGGEVNISSVFLTA